MDAIEFFAHMVDLLPLVSLGTDADGNDCHAFEHGAFGFVEAIIREKDGTADLVSPLMVNVSEDDSLRALLNGSAQGSGSGHGALVIHPVHGPALQTRLALAELDAESFDRLVGAHLLYARMWHEDEGIGMNLTPPADAMGASANEVILHL